MIGPPNDVVRGRDEAISQFVSKFREWRKHMENLPWEAARSRALLRCARDAVFQLLWNSAYGQPAIGLCVRPKQTTCEADAMGKRGTVAW